MNAENLDKEFVAVAYVTDGTNYYFATPAQGARAVSVAQKALLNDKDEIHTVEGGADRVNAAYINAYLGAEGKEVTYTENVYKQLKNGEYAVSPEEKTAIVKSYNDSTKPNAPNGYTEFTLKNGASETIMFDGSTTVDYYYNYSANRVVLWDGDENLADTNYGSLQYWNNQPSSGVKRFWAFDVNEDQVNTYKRTNNNGTPNDTSDDYEEEVVVNYPAHPDKTIWEGKSGSIKASLDSWDGPLWITPKEFGFETDTITFIMDTTFDMKSRFNLNVYSVKADGSSILEQSVGASTITYTAEPYEIYGENNGYNDDNDPATLEAGLYKITLKLATPTTNIKAIAFRLKFSLWNAIYHVDNICAENPLYIEGDAVVPQYFNQSLEFNAPTIKSTTAWEGETVEATFKYKKADAEDYSDLALVDGKYTVPVEDGVNTYNVQMTVGDKVETYTVRRGIEVFAFNEGEVDRDYVIAAGYNTAGQAQYSGACLWDESKGMYKFTAWASLYIQGKSESGGSFNFTSLEGITATKMLVYVYTNTAWGVVTTQDEYNALDSASRNRKFGFDVYGTNTTNDTWANGFTTMVSGYTEVDGVKKMTTGYVCYEFDLANPVTGFRAIRTLGLQWSNTNPYWIDSIAFIA